MDEKTDAEKLRAAQFTALVDSSEDAIISKDLQGMIRSWNPAAERIYGYTAEEMIGQSILRLLPADRIDEEDLILARLRAGERVEHFQTVRVTRDGRKLHVSLTISPIHDEYGAVIGASKIARDITEQKKLELERDHLLEREQELRTEAERANRLKNEFLATLSHELRTPLTAISGWAQILQVGKPEEDTVRRAAEVIIRNTNLQTQLIDELLDMNRILMGKLRLDLQMVDPCTILETALESAEPAAAAKQIEVRKALDPRAGQVRGDPTRLLQIIWNLVSNAVKFTPPGGRVTVSLERVDSHMEIAVADTGIGIPAEFLPLVFDRFSQNDTTRTRRHGGLGLGLAIVKHLTELHGGSVHVESEGLDRGSTFRIRLPSSATVARASAEEPLRSLLSDPEVKWQAPDLSGQEILVVDDDRDAAEMIAHLLGEVGAELTQAHSAAEALARISGGHYALLISDIGMPGMDGFELIRKLRESGGNAAGIPAIALTAFGRAEDRRNAMISGFDVFLSKPIDATELIATAARVIRRGAPPALPA